MSPVVPLVCIDTSTLHVRRYQARRPGGRPICTHEGILQMDSPTLRAGLEAFREGGYAADPEEPLAA